MKVTGDHAENINRKWYWRIHSPTGGKTRQIEIKTGMIIHIYTTYQYEKIPETNRWKSKFKIGHWLMFAIIRGKLNVFDSAPQVNRGGANCST